MGDRVKICKSLHLVCTNISCFRYFDTLDMTLDRAGYYICWGCLVWIPSFYTFHSYYFVYHQPNCGPLFATVVFILGVIAIYLNYEVDRQKELFRGSGGKTKVIFYSSS